MRIGILTFHRAINYGAVLQCYALYTTLKKLGHDVEIIDYRPECIEKYRMYFRKKDFNLHHGLFGKIRYLLSSLFLIPSRKRTTRNFDYFLKNYLHFSEIIDKSNSFPFNYDVIFFGSDQIWSPVVCEGLNNIYYGQFPKKKAKFVSYAASIGDLDVIRGEIRNLFQKYILVYDSISVRERQACDFLNNICSVKSSVVCDPTILLSKSCYLNLAKLPSDKNYVLLFSLVDDRIAFNFASHIAGQIGAKVIALKALTNPFTKKNYIRGNIAPEEFLGYIHNARCVVTNSFHATSLSILMEKDFYTLLRINNNDRAKTLLQEVGLSSRLVDPSQKLQFSAIDYSEVYAKIEAYRKNSLDFINKSLNLE